MGVLVSRGSLAGFFLASVASVASVGFLWMVFGGVRGEGSDGNWDGRDGKGVSSS